MSQNEFIIVKNALVGRGKKNPDQKWVKIGDGDDAYFATTLDDNIVGMKGQDLSLEIQHVFKNGRHYHNIRSWHVADELDHATRPVGGSRPPQTAPNAHTEEMPFATARSMEILIQTCLKEVVAANGLAGAAEEAVALARLVRDAAQASPHSKGAAPADAPPIGDIEAEQELARQHAQQQQFDDDIPF